MLDIEPDPGIGPAREVLLKPEKVGKGTGDTLTIRTVLPGLIGLEVALVHWTETTGIDTRKEVA